MADLSKIKLNGTEYDIKDAVARGLIPEVEEVENVTDMLTSFGLNTTTTLEPAAAGSAETGTAVVQADEEEEEGEGE